MQLADMSTRARVAAFGAVLALAAGAAALVGAAIDPLRDDAGDGHGHGGAHPAAGGAPYSAVAEAAVLPRGQEAPFVFRIAGPDGRTVRDFDVAHERRMHLIVVRHDLTGFQHLHPAMDARGRWITPVRLPEAGSYRAYADFSTAGRPRTVAMDVSVAGPFRPAALPAPAPVAVAGRYEVRLDARLDRPGAAELSYEVRRDGAPAAGIQPYLGADGHLVALREGDLAFLHVHPEPAGEPGRIRFGADFPSQGRYRLFLQFRHDGKVQTVAHTVRVGP
jgi:hypothetical protein